MDAKSGWKRPPQWRILREFAAGGREACWRFAYRVALTAVCCLLGAIGAPAVAASVEIHGKVLDSGNLSPMIGAEVLLFRAADKGSVVTGETYSESAVLRRVQTGADGSFRFTVEEPGAYRVQAKKEGYGEAGPMNRGVTSAVTVVAEPGGPAEEVRLLLALPGEIRAVVADEENGKPFSGQSVTALQVFYSGGERRALPSGFGVTDEKGEVSIRGLTPADYVIKVRIHPFGSERIVRNYREDDVERIDQGFVQPYSDVNLSLPATVRSGGQVYLGTIALRPVPLYRVRFSFPPGVCGDGAMVNTAIANLADRVYEITADVPCQESFLVKGFIPGSYHAVTYLRAREREELRRGSVTFEIIDRNLSLELPLERGVDVSGRLALPGGVAMDFETIHARLRSVRTVPRREDLEQIPIGSDGEFHVSNVAAGDKRLNITGLPAGFYVRTLRYNGNDVPGDEFRLDSGQLMQKLEVVIANDAGVIYGTIRDGDKPQNRAFVVAVPADKGRRGIVYPLRSAEANGRGAYRLEGLPPGEYLVLAVQPGLKPDLENPGILDAFLKRARKITVAPNGVQLADLPLMRGAE